MITNEGIRKLYKFYNSFVWSHLQKPLLLYLFIISGTLFYTLHTAQKKFIENERRNLAYDM